MRKNYAQKAICKRIMEKNKEGIFQDYSDYSDGDNYSDYGDSSSDWT